MITLLSAVCLYCAFAHRCILRSFSARSYTILLLSIIHVFSWALTVLLLNMAHGYDIVYHLFIPLMMIDLIRLKGIKRPIMSVSALIAWC
jgi:hypothetical protein